MNTDHEDKYLAFEDLNKATMDFAAVETEKFRNAFRNESERIRKEIRRFSDVVNIMQVKINGEHKALLYRERDIYSISVDGTELVRSDKIITWFSTNESFSMLSYFETEGSDLGDLYILDSGKIKEKLHGFFGGVKFFGNHYYILKSFRGEDQVEGVEKNAERVILDGKIVWGEGIGNTEFIDIDVYGKKCLVSVGNWMKTTIYGGQIEDTSTWEKLYSFDSPAQPLGILGNDVYILKFSKNGVVLKNETMIIEFEHTVENVIIVSEGLLAFILKDARLSTVLYDFNGKIIKEMRLEEASGLITSSSDLKKAAFYSSSLGIPYSEYIFENGNITKVSELKLIDAEIKDEFADSSGTRVHYFLASGKNSRHRRALVYGYGGFNVSTTPGYRFPFAYLLSKGVDIVLCNLRGGSEYGENWHLDGIRDKKINVFKDFFSVIKDLRIRGYDIVIEGASNGGLLTSYTLINHPESIKGAVIGKPVIDVLRFHLLYTGVYWVNEYGDPENEVDRKFLADYSPYSNIASRKYPASLIWTRMNDDRVHPAHALKFYAKLKETGSETYLRADFSGGHIGLTHERQIEESCDILSFELRCLGEVQK